MPNCEDIESFSQYCDSSRSNELYTNITLEHKSAANLHAGKWNTGKGSSPEKALKDSYTVVTLNSVIICSIFDYKRFIIKICLERQNKKLPSGSLLQNTEVQH